MPAVPQWEPWVLAVEDVERIAEAIEPRYQPLVLVGAYAALRWSELVGLGVSDVDFMRGRLRVATKITETGGG